MRNARTQNRYGILLSLALVLPMVGCMVGAEEDLDDAEMVEEWHIEDGTVVEVVPAAGCTLSAAPLYRGTVSSGGTTQDAIIGQASAACTSRTNINIKVNLRNDTTGGNVNWSRTCYEALTCSIDPWARYSPGTWYMTVNSLRTSPSTVIVGPQDF